MQANVYAKKIEDSVLAPALCVESRFSKPILDLWQLWNVCVLWQSEESMLHEGWPTYGHVQVCQLLQGTCQG